MMARLCRLVACRRGGFGGYSRRTSGEVARQSLTLLDIELALLSSCTMPGQAPSSASV
jgi:hypothetical protein